MTNEEVLAFLRKANECGIINFKALEECEALERYLLNLDKQGKSFDSNILFNKVENVLEVCQVDFFKLGILYAELNKK